MKNSNETISYEEKIRQSLQKLKRHKPVRAELEIDTERGRNLVADRLWSELPEVKKLRAERAKKKPEAEQNEDATKKKGQKRKLEGKPEEKIGASVSNKKEFPSPNNRPPIAITIH